MPDLRYVLVPVKKSTTTNSRPSIAAPIIEPTTQNTRPSEFTVPIERQQLIGVTYATVEMRPLQLQIRTPGIVAYDKQRHWDYVSRVDGYVQKLARFLARRSGGKRPAAADHLQPRPAHRTRRIRQPACRATTRANPVPRNLVQSADRMLQSARQRLRLWNITDKQIERTGKNASAAETLTLYSPFKGVVQDLHVDQGRHVTMGDHLVDVADLSVVWVWAQFYQDELPLLKKGVTVTITTVVLSRHENFNGKIVSSILSSTTPAAPRACASDVENPDFKLRPDMYVDMTLEIDRAKAWPFPASAVLPTGERNIVFVDKGEGKLEPRFVELGRKYGDFYEVKSGLKEGERVVDSANFLIDAEAKVQGALEILVDHGNRIIDTNAPDIKISGAHHRSQRRNKFLYHLALRHRRRRSGVCCAPRSMPFPI